MSDSVEALLDRLWPGADLSFKDTTLHVVATWVHGKQRHVIKIAEHGPRSDTDFFLLNLARARADAVLTTGKILRDEPQLRYDLQGEHAEALHRWRSHTLGKADPARVLVLSSGRDLDLDHPTFSSWARPVVITSSAGKEHLEHAARTRDIEVVALANTSARAAVQWARDRGARTVSIEAGPSTARAFYAKPLAIDELWLSEFAEPDLPHDLRGPTAVDDETLVAQFGHPRAIASRMERSGRWRFSRYVRS